MAMKSDGRQLHEKMQALGASTLFASRLFERGRHQVHHKCNTVAGHTMEVVETTDRICRFLTGRLHLSVRTEDALLGALCHDLGIIGRDRKFKNDFECCYRHPVDSVRAARRLLPEVNDNVRNIIVRHMWPYTLMPPGSREGWIVIAADKTCAFRDRIRTLRRKRV